MSSSRAPPLRKVARRGGSGMLCARCPGGTLRLGHAVSNLQVTAVLGLPLTRPLLVTKWRKEAWILAAEAYRDWAPRCDLGCNCPIMNKLLPNCDNPAWIA